MLSVFSGIALALDPGTLIERGAQKSQVCSACHNVDGNSTVAIWPKIAKQPEKYFIEQMKAFRKGEKGDRFDPTMYALVQSMSDEDFVELSAYYFSQQPTVGSTQQKWVSLGEKIYRGGNPKTGVVACGACHSPHGLGNTPAGFPRLSGQHPEYVIAQLKKFRSGERRNDPNGMMQDISKRMTDEEIEAIANYVSGLH